MLLTHRVALYWIPHLYRYPTGTGRCGGAMPSEIGLHTLLASLHGLPVSWMLFVRL